MQRDRISAFGGMAGRVLHESLTGSTIVTGVVLGVAVTGLAVLMAFVKAPTAFSFLCQVVMALALARFAANGQCGEWRGTVFSSAGGSWTDVVPIAARYLTLTALWLVPFVLFGFRTVLEPEDLQNIVMQGPGALAGLGIYVLLSTITPPLFLILSASATALGDLFKPMHWKRVFGGRTGDLYGVYSTYLGGLCVAAFVSVPPTIGILFWNWKIGLVFAALTFAFLFGLTLALLGRLCGFFLLADGHEIEWVDTAPSTARSGRGGGRQLKRRKPAARAPAAPAAPAPPLAQLAATSASRRIILDLPQRIDQAWERFKTDPPGAVRLLDELRDQSMSPSAQLLHAITAMKARMGDHPGAIAAAKETLPLCFERGNLQLAADVFRLLRHDQVALGLTRDQVLAIGGALRHMQDWKNAANAYASVLQIDTHEQRAIKGLLQVAGVLLHQQNAPSDAHRLYVYLMRACADSPFVQEIREGLATAEARLQSG